MIRNLVFLNIAEIFERMAYYGVRSILILYMINGLSMDQQTSFNFYGYFSAGIYLFAIAAGLLSDFSRKPALTAIIGNILTTVGIFALAFSTGEITVLASLGLIAIGTGTYKPAILGALYRVSFTHKHRFDLILTVFYTAINIGAFLAPLVIGAFAESGNPESYKIGFIVAGVISLVPTILLFINYNNLIINDILYDNQIYRLSDLSITRIVIYFLLSVVFWLAYELFPMYTGAASTSSYQIIVAFAGLVFMSLMIPIHLIPNFRSALKLSIGLLLAVLVCFLVTVIGGSPLTGMIVLAAAEALVAPLLMSQIILATSHRFTATVMSLFMVLTLLTNKLAGEFHDVKTTEQPIVLYVLGLVMMAAVGTLLAIDSKEKNRELRFPPHSY